jgi:hypothetical protein
MKGHSIQANNQFDHSFRSSLRCGTSRSQLFPHVLGLEFLYPLDEVCLLNATVALLIPITQNLPQVTYLQFLQVDCFEINSLV